MAAIDFPENVPVGYIHIQNSKSWTWSGQVWNATGVDLDADDIDDTLTTHKFVTQTQLDKADSALQNGDNITELTNNAGYITSTPVDSVNTKTGVVVLDADDIDDSATTHKFASSTQLDKADSTYTTVLSNSATNWDNTANTLDSVTSNGATTKNNIKVGTIATLHPTATVNDNSATGLQSASIGGKKNIASGIRSTTFGGRDNAVSGEDSTAVGGNNQKVFGNESEGVGSTNLKLFSKYTTAVGAANSTIGTLNGVEPNPEAFYADDSFAIHSIILGGENIEIQHAEHAATVGGDANTVETNHHRSVILGGTGITTDASDTAYVQNLNVKSAVKIPTGAADTYVLTSDANGVGTWQAPDGGVGVSITETATFINSSGSIQLANVTTLFAAGMALGDVISISGSTSNDGEYTVSYADPSNIGVNPAHSGGTTSKSFTDETATDNVTVTLVAKANVAALGYGQGWVDVTLDRAVATNYTNSTGRSITVLITKDDDGLSAISIDGISLPGWRADGANNVRVPMSVVVPPGSTYSLGNPPSGNFHQWAELR